MERLPVVHEERVVAELNRLGAEGAEGAEGVGGRGNVAWVF